MLPPICTQCTRLRYSNKAVSHSHIHLIVIFLVDVKVTFDEFKQSMIGTCDQKTIITTNPGTIHHHNSSSDNGYVV